MMIKPTQHPIWIVELLDFLKPYQQRIVNCAAFQGIGTGSLTMEQFRFGLVNFYPLIENFPKFMALNLAKLPNADTKWNKTTRDWLIANINQERLHAVWWKRWAIGFGVARDAFDSEISPPPAMDAINEYLWKVCTKGSLAEGISAVNFAIEGPTGEWTRILKTAIEKYYPANPRILKWVTAHASYDDAHPQEALEIIKALASTRTEQEKVRTAAKRSMQYYAMALEALAELPETN